MWCASTTDAVCAPWSAASGCVAAPPQLPHPSPPASPVPPLVLVPVEAPAGMVLLRNLLESPGWSTSWHRAARRMARMCTGRRGGNCGVVDLALRKADAWSPCSASPGAAASSHSACSRSFSATSTARTISLDTANTVKAWWKLWNSRSSLYSSHTSRTKRSSAQGVRPNASTPPSPTSPKLANTSTTIPTSCGLGTRNASKPLAKGSKERIMFAALSQSLVRGVIGAGAVPATPSPRGDPGRHSLLAKCDVVD
mmetsp:Transcript_37966/g.94126  ORF Transcript_37966/g.94126 Transcript_37966/m.94126 type:complete len:254 (-) Transcript_37966:219-980(-)